MKKIPLRTITEQQWQDGETKDIQFSYSNIMLQALRSGGVQGVGIEQIRQRMGAIAAIEKAARADASHVLLEEEQHKTLVEQIRAFRFNMVVAAALDFYDEIENAATVEVKEDE